ncbi:ferredoxin [Zymomonas mobilis]|uniref:2Fe-2S iron-sulfur cluster-binding protein n=1 Tax=Zymomonas mobilis TaxID=542 RepID=UPI00026D7E85|nr:2Fe-2S iron-sulfur cluster-binding protein [Zymomonas mobilis]AFN56335.1 ferredoxin [Zymomonas mobilis subsp. mobilis ATCC 29191]TQK78235.1 ferredoxin [Zymomonas mobilis]TQL15119.1 ferredoxin [Zymomonas mobilis]GEB87556.1 2Fe-2S ferredoxin [Zymomonas mobilis subsp. mobilis]
MSVTVLFIDQQQKKITCQAEKGDKLLDVIHKAGLPIEGTCEGALTCATCHVVIEADNFRQLEVASDIEEDMLDLAFDVEPTSRLACQVYLPDCQHFTVYFPQDF